MSIIHAVVLAVVQGLTEFFPVSSSGHLALVPWLFGWDDFEGRPELQTAFDVAVHLGTLAGAVAYFRKDIWRYITAGLPMITDAELRRNPSDDGRVAWLLLLTAIPGAITGLLLGDLIDSLDDDYWLIGVMLIVFGLVLAWADRLAGARPVENFGLRDALLMGTGQALALQPGVSRSGVTMTVGRWLGFQRDAAVRISFLMSMPIIAGAGLYSLIDVMGSGGIPSDMVPAFVVGMVTAAITGWLAVWATIAIVRASSFDVFVIYRIVLGVSVIVIAATGWR